jgi:S-phase kinase-associated protein 1
MSLTKFIGTIHENVKPVVLISKEGVELKVDINTATQSITIKELLENFGEDLQSVPLTNLTADTIEKVMIFCDYIQNNPDEAGALSNWLEDRTFTVPLSKWFYDYINIDSSILFQIINASNHLDIQLLLNLGCKHIASNIRYSTPEQLKKLFGQEEAGGAGAAATE